MTGSASPQPRVTTKPAFGRILSYAAYLPAFHLKGKRVRGIGRTVASFDEDSTTLAVGAGGWALLGASAEEVWMATTNPAYADKTNATAVHVALTMADGGAYDVGSGIRGGVAAVRAAASSRTAALAVCADVRVGAVNSADEREGADAAAAFVFAADGDTSPAIAEIIAERSQSIEMLDRWRSPGGVLAGSWEDRFVADQLLGAVLDTVAGVLQDAGIDSPDHIVVSAAASKLRSAIQAAIAPGTEALSLHFSGSADLGVRLADVLDRAQGRETILVVQVADGCDVLLLRTTAEIEGRRAPMSVRVQMNSTVEIDHHTYQSWRGLLIEQPPRRPVPDSPAAPSASRAVLWKFGFVGSQCSDCGFVHLPPAKICASCRSDAPMRAAPRARARGRVATYTVDRLAYSPAPPLTAVVVDFAGGGRTTLELTDITAPPSVGMPVELTFRRFHSTGGVHNYFWKARKVREEKVRQ